MAGTIDSKTVDDQTSRGGMNIALLHKILTSFGAIRSFIFNRQDIGNEDVSESFVPFKAFLIFNSRFH